MDAREQISFSQSTGLFQKIEKMETVENIKDKCITGALLSLVANGNNTPENQEAILAFPKYAVMIARGLNELKEDQALTTQNRLRLCAHAEFAYEIAVAIGMLNRSNIYTLSNWLLLAKLPERANVIAASFEYLKKAGIFTDLNKNTICDVHSGLNIRESINFGNLISIVFYDRNLTQENFDKLCANPTKARQLVDGLESKSSNRKTY